MKKRILPLLTSCIVLLSALNALAQNDSLQKSVPTPVHFKKGDTIANLNLLNNGVKSVLIPEKTKIPKGLAVDAKGIITVTQSGFLNTSNLPIVFELKTYTSDKEFYINSIQIVKQNQQLLVYVSADKIEMATGWRQNGKIYIVVVASLILFFVIIGYLILLDRRTKAALRK